MQGNLNEFKRKFNPEEEYVKNSDTCQLVFSPGDTEALWESENKKGYIHGFTSNYVKLRKLWNPALVNTLEKVQLTRIDEEGFVRAD